MRSRFVRLWRREVWDTGLRGVGRLGATRAGCKRRIQYQARSHLKRRSGKQGWDENIPFPLPAVGEALAALVVVVVGVIAGACRIRVSGSMSL